MRMAVRRGAHDQEVVLASGEPRKWMLTMTLAAMSHLPCQEVLLFRQLPMFVGRGHGPGHQGSACVHSSRTLGTWVVGSNWYQRGGDDGSWPRRDGAVCGV